ncbi:hypothetical protein EMCRGX_G019791 [Ephydatia muelleri]
MYTSCLNVATVLLFALLTAYSTAVQEATIRFLTVLEDLDDIMDNSSLVVNGSMVLLFCSAIGNTAPPTISWTRDGVDPESPPIVHITTTVTNLTNLTSSMLTIRGFSPATAGLYECRASLQGTTIQSSINLNAATNGTLSVTRELTASDTFDDDQTDWRIYVTLNSNTQGNLLSCAAECTDLFLDIYPNVTWYKDGRRLMSDGMKVIITEQFNSFFPEINSSVSIFNFTQSDAGIYQCVFFTSTEVLTSAPLRLDTGPVSLTAVSPSLVYSSPPAPIVAEVYAQGEYSSILWSACNSPSTQYIINFGQTLVRTDPSPSDYGPYTASLDNSSNETVTVVVTQYELPNIAFFYLYPASYVLQGSDLYIICVATGSPPPAITWTLNGQPTPYQSFSFSILPSTIPCDTIIPGIAASYLLITSISSSGNYTCNATNINGSSWQSVYIEVQAVQVAPIRFLTVLEDLDDIMDNSSSVVNGSVVLLFCSAIGNTAPPTISWTRDGVDPESPPLVHITTTVTNLTNLTSSVLTIRGFSPATAGLYECQASLQGTTIQSSINLIAATNGTLSVTRELTASDTFDDDQTDWRIYVTLNSNTQGNLLSCAAECTDLFLDIYPNVTWYKDGRRLMSDGMKVIITEQFNSFFPEINSSVSIFNFTQSDAGIYQCVFFTSTEVLTSAPLRLDTGPVSLTAVSPSLVYSSPPAPIVAEVYAQGEYGSILWSACNSTSTQYIINFGQTLVRTDPSPSDYGPYTASLDNSSNETVTVVVTQYELPNITIFLYPASYVLQGSDLYIICVATGTPPPAITWTLNGQPTPYQSFSFSILPSSITCDTIFPGVAASYLLITSISSSGNYTCNATNINGSSWQNVYIEVQVPPSITTFPENQVKLQSNSISLTCGASGVPTPNITWWRTWSNGSSTQVSDGQNISIITSSLARNTTSTLTIQSAQPSHAGNYTCTTTSVEGSVSATANVFVQVPPNITSPAAGFTYTVNSSHPVTFQCTASGIPPPLITFYDSYGPLTSDVDPRFIISDTITGSVTIGQQTVSTTSRNLIINSTRDKDLGNYTCVAFNNIGATFYSNQTFRLFVQLLLTITTLPANQAVVQLNSISLTCGASGVPTPNITWWRTWSNGSSTQVSDGQKIFIITSSIARNTTSTLTIQSAQPSHAGNYTCTATSLVGSISATANVFVQVLPNITSPAASITYTVNSSDPVTFQCTASGIPPPLITFYNSYGPLSSDVDPRVIISDPITGSITIGQQTVSTTSRNLIINSTRDKDSGNYTCVAFNNIGATFYSNQTFRLFVQLLPTIITLPANQAVVQLNSISLACGASGVPTPNITWWRTWSNASSTQMSDVQNISVITSSIARNTTSTLTIQSAQPSHAGNYTCTATNVVGSVSATANVFVQAAGFTYTVNSSNPVTFQCTASGIPPPLITFYNSYGPLSSDVDPRVIISDPITGSVTIGQQTVSTASRNLTLNSTRDKDSGNYTCVAFNNIGPTFYSNQTFRLFVQLLPTITTLPANQAVVQLNPISLTCGASGVPTPNITWWRTWSNGSSTQVSDGQNISIITLSIARNTTSTLTIQSAQPSHAGNYTCTATNVVGSVSATANVFVQVPPNIISPAAGFTYTVNSSYSVTFQCTASGIPPPLITFYDSYGPLSSDVDPRVIISDPITGSMMIGQQTVSTTSRNLIINSTRDKDSGNYTCVAFNNIGATFYSNQTFRLFVQLLPTITTLPANQAVIQSNSISLTCGASGVPTPNITWWRTWSNGSSTQVSDGQNVSIITSSIARNTTRNLTIQLAQPSHAGNYTCTATNVVGSVSATANLFVHVEPQVIFPPPLYNYIANQTSNVTFVCSAIGIPPPVIQWYPPFGPGSSVALQLPPTPFNTPDGDVWQVNASLTVIDIQQRDTGVYTCLAANGVRPNASQNFTLFVQEIPRITTSLIGNVLINGNTQTFTCVSYAYPVHTVTWAFTDALGNTKNLASGSKYSITTIPSGAVMTSTLSIYNVQYQDRGQYNCTASNVVGTVSSGATLTVHVKPVVTSISNNSEVNISQPFSLQCIATGFPPPILSWSKNGANVPYGPSIFSVNLTTTQLPNSLPQVGSALNFISLQRNDTANYTCVAMNTILTTLNDSQTSQLVILELPDPPINTTISQYGSRWLLLTWMAGFSGNKPITSFNIYGRNLNTSSPFQLVNNQTQTGQYFYNISSGIAPFTNYSFTVQACNQLGCGQSGAVVSTFTMLGTINPSSSSPSTQPASSNPLPIYSIIGAAIGGIVCVLVILLTVIIPIILSPLSNNINVKKLKGNPEHMEVPLQFVSTTENICYESTCLPEGDRIYETILDNGVGYKNLCPHPVSATIIYENLMASTDPLYSNILQSSSSQPISVATFHNHVHRMHMNGDKGFEQEHFQDVCTQYWIGRMGGIYETDLLTITTVSIATSANFTIRDFAIKSKVVPDLDILYVTQYHYTSWPYNGVPQFATAFLSFVKKAQKACDKTKGAPLLVHCSLGVGCTGVFIVLDKLLKALKSETSISVFDVVKDMKRQRMDMIQTQAQYTFIHDALDEHILCGDTTIIASSLRDHINGKPGCGFQEQFLLLDTVSRKQTQTECSYGAEPFNWVKNRYGEKLPYNSNRVILKLSANLDFVHTYANASSTGSVAQATMIEGSDYINASFVDGYRQCKAYIATQGPLQNTVGDFWRMVWEFRCKIIVMLCPLMEEGRESSYCYWPTEEGSPVSYGNISVTLQSSLIYDGYGYEARTFHIREKSEDKVAVVTQLHYTEWPEHESPANIASVMELLDTLSRTQISTGNKPVVVHCNDGVGRTGAFICIHSELEQRKMEGVADIFERVKLCRIARPGLVETVDQYAFCHKILALCANGCDAYVNSRECT